MRRCCAASAGRRLARSSLPPPPPPTLSSQARLDELFAAARYGQARVLERLGRNDEAIGAYQVVAQLKTGGTWRKLAGFGLRFARWRQKVASQKEGPQTK